MCNLGRLFKKSSWTNSKVKATASEKAAEIIALTKQGKSVDKIRSQVAGTAEDWHRFSGKAYSITLANARKQNKANEKKKHVSATTNSEVNDIIELNNVLSNYALLLPIFCTMPEFRSVQALVKSMPRSESNLVAVIGGMTMHPRLRALQKRGRFERLKSFKELAKLVDAATLCYYRNNFISCYLTLVPVVEGVLIRWMGFDGTSQKPEFEDIRKFFKNSHQRQPCPYNILYHDVYTRACDLILNNHFYRPTDRGKSYSEFNRHVASHLLSDNQFATRENCIRLYILLDAMAEIFFYESRAKKDQRFETPNSEIDPDITQFGKAILDGLESTPEHVILGVSFENRW